MLRSMALTHHERRELHRHARELSSLLEQTEQRNEEHLEVALENEVKKIAEWWLDLFGPKAPPVPNPYTNGPYSLGLVWKINLS